MINKGQNIQTKKKRFFGQGKITSDTEIHSQEYRPNKFIAPNKRYLRRRRRRRWSSSVAVGPHRRRRGILVRFLLSSKLLQLRCYRKQRNLESKLNI